jgi:hypothetical protein
MARFADSVMTLADGGSMMGFLSAADWIALNPLQDETPKDEDPPKPETGRSSLPRATKKPQEQDKDEQIKRQVGDGTVWAYYAKSVGVLPIVLLMLFTAAATVGNGFPREFVTCFGGSRRLILSRHLASA